MQRLIVRDEAPADYQTVEQLNERAFGGPGGLANLSPSDMSDIIVYLHALGKKNARKR